MTSDPSNNLARTRELAVKLLYLVDINSSRTSDVSPERLKEIVQEVIETENPPPNVRDAAVAILNEVTEVRDDIDAKLTDIAANWRLSRMPFVDRAILRVGAFELLYRHEVPPKVSINEAIELAKTYSTEKSGSFVNGILDKLYQTYCPEKV